MTTVSIIVTIPRRCVASAKVSEARRTKIPDRQGQVT
jgi:hypothetical protein